MAASNERIVSSGRSNLGLVGFDLSGSAAMFQYCSLMSQVCRDILMILPCTSLCCTFRSESIVDGACAVSTTIASQRSYVLRFRVALYQVAARSSPIWDRSWSSSSYALCLWQTLSSPALHLCPLIPYSCGSRSSAWTLSEAYPAFPAAAPLCPGPARSLFRC
jgi:hypothetical protein